MHLQCDFMIPVRNVKRMKNTDRIFELHLRMLLILQDPRRDLICMLGYALAPGNLHAFEDYARVCVPMGTGEARDGGMGRAETRANISLCGSPCCRASVG